MLITAQHKTGGKKVVVAEKLSREQAISEIYTFIKQNKDFNFTVENENHVAPKK